MRWIRPLFGFAFVLALGRCGGGAFSSASTGGAHGDGGSGGTGETSSGGRSTGGSSSGGSGNDTGIVDAAADAIGSAGSGVVDASGPCGVALDNVSHTAATNVAELGVSHKVIGPNPLLIVTIAIRHDNNVPNTIPYATSVTYGTHPLSKLKALTDNYYQAAEIWALVAPPLGTGNVGVQFSAAPMNVAIGAISFTGVLQTSPLGPTFGVAGGNASVGAAVPSYGFAAYVDVLSHSAQADWTPTSPQIPLWSDGNIAFGGQSSTALIKTDTNFDSWSTTASASNVVLLGVPFVAAPCP